MNRLRLPEKFMKIYNVNQRAWFWLSDNNRAIGSLGSIAAVVAVGAATYLGFQQNAINDKLLRLEELRHVPIIKIDVQKLDILEPLPPRQNVAYRWTVNTEFNVSNVGSVPVEILGYEAGEIVEEEESRMMRQKEGDYFNQFIPEATGLVQIIPVGLSKTFRWGNSTYDSTYEQRPSYDYGYRLRVFFKEYPEGENQCIEVKYYNEMIDGVPGIHEFQYSCNS
jgi:hypothetical protein